MDYIIIVAGGKGLRMGSDIPKQFLPVAGKPILMHTLQRFRDYSKTLNIILVLPKSQQEYWQELCKEYAFDVDHTIADGGETRFHSVKNGLEKIPDTTQGIVGVHDGVRPFPAIEVIAGCYDKARTHKAVIPVTTIVETVRKLDGDTACGNIEELASHTVARGNYRLVQTPQTFDIQLLKGAYSQEYTDIFTDDASVVEAYGQQVTLVNGNRENIKITTPFDIIVAEALIK
ncbi:MAG: 2-C-methyl-D-erythritol 4-phosphate cytidylyltransferase [Prevotella sp.]|nr:2-C-methyl-D-erythritol 4-phosphate cytidylyltransferase [Prevotella sp.]MBO5156797.1 2-C-methyl-D-erythritol 4-phosphate cytidylyltransferase [Prevotella sp.]